MGELSILNSVLSGESASMSCFIVTGRRLSFLKPCVPTSVSHSSFALS